MYGLRRPQRRNICFLTSDARHVADSERDCGQPAVLSQGSVISHFRAQFSNFGDTEISRRYGLESRGQIFFDPLSPYRGSPHGPCRASLKCAHFRVSQMGFI